MIKRLLVICQIKINITFNKQQTALAILILVSDLSETHAACVMPDVPMIMVVLFSALYNARV